MILFLESSTESCCIFTTLHVRVIHMSCNALCRGAWLTSFHITRLLWREDRIKYSLFKQGPETHLLLSRLSLKIVTNSTWASIVPCLANVVKNNKECTMWNSKVILTWKWLIVIVLYLVNQALSQSVILTFHVWLEYFYRQIINQ